jgi:filamentous hemagglutinin family protein
MSCVGAIQMAIKTANRFMRLRLAPATTAALLASTALVSAQTALPTGGQVAAGSAAISVSGPAMTVNQGSHRAIVNWQGFSVGQPNSVNFVQPSTSSAILNRVTGSASSTIAGQITGNGQVFLVNPNGIAITATGSVKVGGGFVASTLGIEDRDFMAGRLQFNGGSAPAAVSNDGTITAGSGGFVGLLGGVVSNGGTISVPLGRVGLGAASQATLDPTGDGFLQVAVPSDAKAADGKSLIEVSGKVSAHGGRVEIKAATAQAAVRDAINVSGRVSARSVSGRNGSVLLGGGEGGTLRVAGRVSASGRAGAGKVALSGRVVEVAKGASVKARSEQGQGGSVSLKGDIVNNSGTVDVFGASGGAIDVAGISIGSYGVWNLQGASGAGGAFTARGAQSYVETTSGMVLASGTTAGGSIAIDAPNLFSSGRHDASSSAGLGGKVTLTGERLALVAASIDASGATGGGAVRIGGDYQGGGTLAHAASTTISPATMIRADATQAGNGGSVVVWSDTKTDFYGTISARGGLAGGNGGLVEVSSKGDLVFGGSAAVNAPLGASGTVLLDPRNIVIDNTTGTFAQYQLIDPLQGAVVNQFGASVIQLQGSGKTVVTAHGSTIGGQANAGAVYLYDTVTGALVSSLTGSTAGDYVGFNATALSNGSYVVRTHIWNGNRGAVTWGSGTTGVSGVVSSANSLVGSSANDGIGNVGVWALSNGNYLVHSNNWDGGKGAVTWANGATGLVGTVSSSNSLVGSAAGDNVGNETITELSNGNYVVRTSMWDGGKGAVTWGSGTAGRTGVVSSSNSLVGAVAGDYAGNFGVIALSNGNYVVNSANWGTNKGAVTLGNGTTGTAGTISASNSLIGTVTGPSGSGDRVGIGGVKALTNGNYVVASYNWSGDKGAATWRSGTDTTGAVVSASNSLVGSVTNDQIAAGVDSIMALSNGNYVVRSYNWNGTRGAVTWGNGTTGIVGAVSASNSLVGLAASDYVGITGLTVLNNGHYVVRSNSWDGGKGAVTWGNGATGGTVGAVSASNSLVGSTTTDQVGGSGVTALSNGNYVVASAAWDGGKGAATWGDGATGATVGAVSSSNSLVGTATTDRVGNGGATALSNGNYVVRSSSWDGNRGAATWGNGTTGATVGAVSSSNSLVGTATTDRVGSTGITALSNGNYVVRSDRWGSNVGAVTWGNGATGATVGAVSSSNSLVGSTGGALAGADRVGFGSVAELSNGNYVVTSSNWSGYRGAVTWGSGTAGVSGVLSSSNSLIGGTATGTTSFKGTGDTADVIIASSSADGTSGRVYVGLADLNALTFGRAMAQDVTIRTDAITRQLNAGSALTLQASNDITVNSAIMANNASGNGGHLTLQAGRSILVNAAIITDNGNLTLIGNDRLANGVVDAQRQAGAAVITLGAFVNAGTGTVDVQLRDGAGKTNRDSGAITLNAIEAGKVSAVNSSASGGLTLNGLVTAIGTGDAIVLASNGAFTNNAGNALSLPGGGRWLVYSSSPAAAHFGSLNSGNRAVWNASYSTLPPASVAQIGNRYLFAYQPTLTYTSTDLAKNYGDDATAALASAYSVSGLNIGVGSAYLGDTLGSVVSGAASLSSTGAAVAAGVAGSPHAITITQGSLSAISGYALAFSSTGQLTVAPRAVTVTAAAGQSKVYGNVDPTLAYTVTAGTVLAGDSLTGSLSRTAGETVGSYAINQGSLANPNYTVSFVGSNFGITSRPVTVTATAGQSKGYGDVDPTLTYTVSGSGLAFADSFTGSLSRAAGESMGNYAIGQGSLALNANYTLNYVGGVTFGITPRAVTVSAASGQGKVYGDADAALTYTVTAGSLLAGDSFSGTLSRAAGENVGTYAIGLGSLALNANYTLSYAGSNFGITPRAVTVSASSGQGKVYGNVDPTLTYTVTAGTVLAGDSFSGALSRAAGENVGTYAIGQGSLALSSNYTLSYAGSNFGITPRAVTVEASSGQNKVYGNVDPTLAYTVTAGTVLAGDSFSGALSRAAGENVGTYAIGQGSLALSSNYTLSYAGSNFGITPRAVTVTASSGQGKVYGNADAALTYTLTAGSLAFADTFSGALSRAAGENVGNYAIGQGTLALNANYALSYAGSNFGITPRAVTVTASSGQGKVYGNGDPGLTYAVTAGTVLGGDNFTGSLDRAAGENIGNYAIGQGTLSLGSNYTLSYAGSNFGITPRAVTVAATAGQSKTYGDADPTLAYTVTAGSLAFADGFGGALSRAVGENVGSYAIGQGTLTLGSNYTLSYAGSNFGVTPRAVTVSATAGQGKAYGDADSTLAYTVTAGSLAFADAFSGALSRAAGENVGNYAIGQGSLALNANYTLSYAGSNFGVTPRAVTVSATAGQGKVYGNADAALAYTVTAGNLVGADAFSGTLSRAAGENAGNYAIGQGTLALSSNYTLSYAGSNFGITPRAVTVSATAGQGKTYGDVDPALAYALTAGSLVGADTFSGGLSRTAGENVGNYAIGQGTLTLGSNYMLSYAGSNFGITPRAVTVSATAGQGKIYGDSDAALAYAVTAGNVVGADTFSGALSRAAGEDVGNYAIGQGSLTLGANYTLSYAGSNFAVTPRAVTVSATAGQGKTYGDADAALTYALTAGSLVGADAFSGALSRTAGENVGNYAIGQGTLALSTNYTLSYAGSNFAVTPRAVTATATAGQGKVHGTVDPALTYSLTAGSLVAGDSFSGTLSRAAGEDVGTYAIDQGTLALSANYTLSYVGSSFGITARPRTTNPLPALATGNVWTTVVRQSIWLGDQTGEVPGAVTGYVETSSPEGFRNCHPAKITFELINSGRVQLSGSDTACGR